MSQDARERTRSVHLYPSRMCSYTLAKQRVFIKVRDHRCSCVVTPTVDVDPQGQFIPDCVLRHVILHELAHTINPTEGHASVHCAFITNRFAITRSDIG